MLVSSKWLQYNVLGVMSSQLTIYSPFFWVSITKGETWKDMNTNKLCFICLANSDHISYMHYLSKHMYIHISIYMLSVWRFQWWRDQPIHSEEIKWTFPQRYECISRVLQVDRFFCCKEQWYVGSLCVEFNIVGISFDTNECICSQ